MEQSITSASAFYKAAHGKKVIKRVVEGRTAEDWPAMAKEIKRQLLEQGCPEENIIETEDEISIKNSGQFWRKPKMHREQVGILTVRSKDYIFTPEGHERGTHGDKAGAKVVDGKLVKSYEHGPTLSFELAQ